MVVIGMKKHDGSPHVLRKGIEGVSCKLRTFEQHEFRIIRTIYLKLTIPKRRWKNKSTRALVCTYSNLFFLLFNQRLVTRASKTKFDLSLICVSP